MMKMYKDIMVVMLLLIFNSIVNAQSPLHIQIQVTKPYPNKLNDFQSNPNQIVIMITNTSQTSYTVQLRGAVSGDNNISLRTVNSYRSARPLLVAPNALTRLTAEDIGELFNADHFVFSGITKQEALRLNGLPEGVYQVCIQTVDYTTHAALSDEEPIGCSNIFMVTSLEPPVIIRPFDEDSLKAYTPQNIVFSWSLPPGAPPTTQYEVRLVEMPDAQRNPFDVMRSSRQTYFERLVIGAPTMLYGPSDPPLIAGRRYAMMVTAIDPFSNVVFRNGGRSAVIAFTYGLQKQNKGTYIAKSNTRDILKINIPRSVISGKINWYFKATEEKESLLTGVKGIGNFIETNQVNALLDPSAGTQYNSLLQQTFNTTQPIANQSSTKPVVPKSSGVQDASNKSVNPTKSVVISPRASVEQSPKQSVGVTGAGTVTNVTATATLSSGAYNGSAGFVAEAISINAPHPLQRVAIRIYAVNDAGDESFMASTTTNDEGYFEASFINSVFYNSNLGSKYKVYINHPDFLLQQNLLSLPKPDSSGRYDVGTLSAVARTFRLKPSVVDEEGKAVDDAHVEVYRPVLYYSQQPNQKAEGTFHNNDAVIVNGQSCIKVASIRSGHTGSRLFYSDDWMDKYIIKVVHPKLLTLTSTLQVTAAGDVRDEIVTVEKTYNTQTRMPTLKGQVSKRLQPIIDVSGAIVTLYFNDDAQFGKSGMVAIETLGKAYTASATMNDGAAKNGVVVNAVNNVAKPSGAKAATSPSPSGGGQPKLIVGNSNIIAPATYTVTGDHSFVGEAATSVNAAAVLANTRSTTTDSAGYFLFTNLPISAQPTRITIRIPGSEKVYEFTADINAKGQEIDMGRILLDMVMITVGGVVKNEEAQPITRPVLRWASGGSPFEGDDYGRFVATTTAGKDTLIVTKLGFETKRIPTNFKEPASGDNKKKSKDNVTAVITPGAWAQSVQELPSFVNLPTSSPQPSPPPVFSANGLGFNTLHTTYSPATGVVIQGGKSVAYSKPIDNNDKKFSKVQTSALAALAPLYSSLITGDAQPAAAVDLGVITLRKRIGRLSVKVFKDSDKTILANASISIIDTPLTGKTNAEGTWYSEVPGGEIVVEIKGDDGSPYVATQKQVAMSDTEITVLEVYLKNGVRVTGKVTVGAQAIAEAAIGVDGFDYLNAITDAMGNYILIVPQGDYTLQATKSGYVGDEKQQKFSGTTAIVNFALTQPGFDVTTILGFPVTIEKMEGTGNTRVLTGAFENLPGNTMFNVKPGTRIPFDHVTVNIVGGKPIPQGGEVTLSITTLDVLAFNFLPVKIKNNNQALTIKQRADNNAFGQLNGIAEIDYVKWIPIPLGLTIPDNFKHQLSTIPISILQTGEGFVNQESLALSLGSSTKLALYGFELTLGADSKVKADGLHLKGEISFNGVPLLGNTTMQVNELALGTDGSIKKVDINIGTGISVSMAGWGASLRSVSINENGLKLSGNITVKVPSSAPSVIGFDNLSVSKTALYGGDFSLPAQGLDIFGIVKMKPGQKPLTFGRIGNTNVHYIGGSGQFNLPKFIDKTLSVEFFQIQTDGNFAATVPANFNVNLLSMADISIRSIGFTTIGGVGIDVVGDFNLNGIPFFKATVGGIHYKPGGSVSVDELGVSCDLVGIAKLSARAKFSDQPDRKGFEGSGSIEIIATPLKLELGFKYYKLPHGIEVGGLLKVGVIIPIGAVTLTEVQGEFSLNTQDKKWMGRIGGSLSIGALNAAIAIKPLSITVQNGPVFTLDGGLAVIGQTIAKAQGVLDFPKSYLGFTFEQKLDFLPELVTMNGGGAFIISTATNNTYWLMGVRYDASMLGGLVKGNANVTAGWGLNVDAHPEFSDYTSFIDRSYLNNGTVEGVHVATFAGIDFNTGERGFKGIATGAAWYYNYGAVNMDLGFGRGRYGFRVAAGWGAGAYIKLFDINVAGVDVGIDGELKGFYDYSRSYLSFEGSLHARLIAWIGNCDNSCVNKICWGACFNACIVGCEVCPIPVGGKLCIHPGVDAHYNSDDGFGMSLDF